MNINIIKSDIQLLIDLGYNIIPIDNKVSYILYNILFFHKKSINFSKLPIEIIRFKIFPYLYPKFNLKTHYSKFKIILYKENIRWILYFNTENAQKYSIPIKKIISSYKTVNTNAIKKQIDDRYYTTYINWLHRITLPFIMLQVRIAMKRWLKSKKNK